MKIHIYSVYDSKTQVFGQPNFMLNKGAALRAWQDASNDKQSNIGNHPADFTMFEIGTWDDETGTITMHPAKINLGCAIEFVRETPPLLHDMASIRDSYSNDIGTSQEGTN